MRRFALTLLAGFALASLAVAQEPGVNGVPPAGHVLPSPSDLPPPAMHPAAAHPDWNRYVLPREIARMRSAAEAEQRQARLSAQRWYGYSPLRPIVSADPTMSNYYPIWNTDVTRPYQWYGVNYPAVFERAVINDVR